MSEPATGILVIPGRSIKVKSGQVGEYTFNIIGLSMMFLFFPQILSVNSSILLLTTLKSVNFSPLISSKVAQGLTFSPSEI
jgi:uncharacterized membrane protein